VKLREASPRQNKPTPEEEFKVENFHELTVDEKIAASSVIAIGSFEKADDGKDRAIISEFLKKEPGVDMYYEVGDELTFMSSYPDEHEYSFDKSKHSFIAFFCWQPTHNEKRNNISR
jgi:hypothetical protein